MLIAARVLIGLFYIVMGLGLIKDFKPVTELMTSKGIPAPDILLPLTIAVWFIGGGALLANFYRKQASIGLLVLTILVTLVIHNFWGARPEQFANEMQHFLKNIAICGALLALAAV